MSVTDLKAHYDSVQYKHAVEAFRGALRTEMRVHGFHGYFSRDPDETLTLSGPDLEKLMLNVLTHMFQGNLIRLRPTTLGPVGGGVDNWSASSATHNLLGAQKRADKDTQKRIDAVIDNAKTLNAETVEITVENLNRIVDDASKHSASYDKGWNAGLARAAFVITCAEAPWPMTYVQWDQIKHGLISNIERARKP